MIRLMNGDCLEKLKELPDCSVDSIVTDPPYELGFMGKGWDKSGIANNVEVWRECLRVLKPGGHLLAFGGSRTYHRMACAVEDAGFEIRDQIMWVYGSGFPKSLDVSKAIDKHHGTEREVVGFDANKMRQQTRAVGTAAYGDYAGHTGDITAPATEAARQWQGWGTALKPAHEPIVVARKPFKGSVAANVLAHGVGALNIDGCRVPVSDKAYARNCSGDRGHAGTRSDDQEGSTNLHTGGGQANEVGRWPANLIHDGSEEILTLFPGKAGAAAPVRKRNGDKFRNSYGAFAGNIDEAGSTFHGDKGSAARFFYCAKASPKDRHEGLDNPGQQFKHGATLRQVENSETKGNNHPTVKPTELMRYLCRLVTPAGGLVLDPFTGSGSTGKAAILEGLKFIGIELNQEYIEIARARINHASKSQEVA